MTQAWLANVIIMTSQDLTHIDHPKKGKYDSFQTFSQPLLELRSDTLTIQKEKQGATIR